MYPLLYLTLVAWILLEVSLLVRDIVGRKGRRGRDRATRIMISLSLDVTFLLAFLAAARVPSLRVPAGGRAIGLIVIWTGLVIRCWAVTALGKAFRTTVEVDADQTVVSDGPYRRIRHPSYTGLLLVVAGFGLARGNLLSFAICLIVPLPALLRRIRVEEAELTRVLGDPYRAYMTQTRRLVPGLW